MNDKIQVLGKWAANGINLDPIITALPPHSRITFELDQNCMKEPKPEGTMAMFTINLHYECLYCGFETDSKEKFDQHLPCKTVKKQ